MIEELCELFRRLTEAATALEVRLRALEMVVVADEQRFVTLALEGVESASERLAGLELTRVLTLSAAGLPVETTAHDLLAGVADPDIGERMRDVIASLVVAVSRLSDARHRAEVVVASGSPASRDRLYAAGETVQGRTA